MGEILFIAGNFLILIASIPNVIRLICTKNVTSYSMIGTGLTGTALFLMGLSYIDNNMYISWLLNLTSTIFWLTIFILKVKEGVKWQK